jgi:hypothetical protein
MRDIRRLNAEMKLAQAVYGPDAVQWAGDFSWVMVYDLPLPGNLNQPESNVLVLVPESYGYGPPYRDAFLSPGLKVKDGGRWRELPHYYEQRYPYRSLSKKLVRELKEKNWSYICLHQSRWDPSSNIVTFLDQIYTFLSDPFRWEAVVRSS